MSTISKLKNRYNEWKNKAVERANMLRYLRKENCRLRKERDQYKKELILAQKQLKNESCKEISPIHDFDSVIYIALQLFLVARIGFQAVSRVLKVMGTYFGLSKTPCTQTIIP